MRDPWENLILTTATTDSKQKTSFVFYPVNFLNCIVANVPKH